MSLATLTSKGQVTIPKDVRAALKVSAGDRISFLLRADGVVELRPQTVELRSLVGILKVESKVLTVEQMNDLIAGQVR